MNEKALKKWKSTWDSSIHESDFAVKRIKSAKSAKLTPVKIDPTDCYGYFQGTHGRYETFLDYCPCGDFHRSKLPCKHIYRLAIELGLMNEKVKNDKNAIATPKNERICLDYVIDIVENLSAAAQRELLTIASNIRSTNPTYLTEQNTYISELIKCGIIVESEPHKYKIKFGNKADILELLESENIQYDKKAKKSVLEELCIKYIPEKAIKKFGAMIYVSIPTKYSSQKIHYYLHRKYDSEICYDENMNFKEIPLLETKLPDDDVTNQLIKRGYYNQN